MKRVIAIKCINNFINCELHLTFKINDMKMKSPITGKEMRLTKERRSMDFRKETFEVVFHYYKCEDSGEQFTTTALDEVNMNQVYNQYRDKFNIPFP
jgi:hypothetical protein